jgi:hypothetical protein
MQQCIARWRQWHSIHAEVWVITAGQAAHHLKRVHSVGHSGNASCPTAPALLLCCWLITALLHRRTSTRSAAHSTSSTSRTSTSSAARTSGRKTAMPVGVKHYRAFSLGTSQRLTLAYRHATRVTPSQPGVHAATLQRAGCCQGS